MSQANQHLFIIDRHLASQLQPRVNSPAADQQGAASVFNRLCPQLYGIDEKRSQALAQVDEYMLVETQELIRRLRVYCQQLLIAGDVEFSVATVGEKLQVLGHFEGKNALIARINDDHWFVGSFNWLQPNYVNLAYSFEMLEYSYQYQISPQQANQRFAHVIGDQKRLCFSLKHRAGVAQAQVETPLNLYHVETL